MKTKPTLLSLALTALLSTSAVQAAPILQTHGDYSHANHSKANAYLEIDVQAFEDNITRLQNTLNDGTKICAIMKADAYGNGIDLLMPSIIKLGVPCIGIASNEEARVARAHGYTGDIMRVRLASGDEVEAALEYNMTELTGSLEHAKTLSDIAKKHGKTLNFHLALNAGGMDRNGIDTDTKTGKKDAVAITKLPNFKITGIMTHYAFEDEDFVRERLAKFNEQSAWLIKAAKLDRKELTLHTANSFSTIAVPESHLDMVRPGGLIYGDTIDAKPAYKPIMSFKTKVASVQFYPAGTTVGYDGTHTLTRDSYLANLPFGYSDGYRRAFTNKGIVLIGGMRAPVLGKTSMNTTMVDVTDIVAKHPVKINDEVVIYGSQGDERITQAEVEEINDALLADLYTIWGNSNPRLIKP
ncbi:alanine racemase [Moraxella sp. FZLJ2107]|uniref:alanine racemase n=1 Tax=unclassified Moraxella TaxID=2685852 RepID=UPI0020C8DA06|nr:MULTISPECIES: alanine racemase [unclassified Moraxella]UTO05312.1 alanine racemase [Moraxella sp. FZLJ2107]UTO22047.1 alanine racemase [Moraxella sp. FZLJ2109]